jgi:8-oxo-dGTP diphosphatase
MTMCASTPSTAADASVLHVAAAAIVNRQREVLLSLRPVHLHQGGLWEFPGGKLEPGESVSQALQREIAEELGIRVGAARPLIRVHHQYADRRVLLDVWRVEEFTGEVRGLEGQLVEWVPIKELGGRAFPAANRPVVQALQLPSAYLITPEPDSRRELFLQHLRQALEAGIELVQLRAPRLAPHDYAQLARPVVALCHQHGARVLLNADAALVEQLNADGLHLNSVRLAQASGRPLSPDLTVIASCHSREQLQQARRIAVDAAVLSPVRPTASHPGIEPLGWTQFAAWVDDCPFPVYALGGVTPADIATAQAHGGQGIAAIRALWPQD